MTNHQEAISLHYLFSAPIQALVKCQEMTSYMIFKHINKMFNHDNYLSMGKFKIHMTDLIQNSTMNIQYADFEFGINVHHIKNRQIFGTYSIDDNPNIRLKIRVKREKLDYFSDVQEAIDALKEEKK